MVKRDVAANGLPIGHLGVQNVSVIFYHFGGIDDVRLRIHEAKHPLRRRLRAQKLRKDRRQLLDWIE